MVWGTLPPWNWVQNYGAGKALLSQAVLKAAGSFLASYLVPFHLLGPLLWSSQPSQWLAASLVVVGGI